MPGFVKPVAIGLALAGGIAIVSMGHGRHEIGSSVHAGIPSNVSVSAIGDSLYKQCGKVAYEKRMSCYSGPLVTLASAGRVKDAMDALNRLGDVDADAKSDGHILAHEIGIAAGKNGGDISATFAKCDPSNQSGCYHGVIQAYFAQAKTIGPTEVNALCLPFKAKDADRWIRFQCVHGMGHGFEMIYNHDLPKSLDGCDLLDDDWDRDSCYGGVFMENIVNVSTPDAPGHDMAMHMSMPAQSGTPFKAVDPSDPLYPCSAVGQKYQSACYQMQTSVILYLNHDDMAATAKTCDTAPPAMRFVCYQSLGRDVSAYSAQDFGKARAMCSLGTPRYQPWCYVGFVKNLVDLNARASDGLAFCAVLTGEFNKLKCFQAVGEEISSLRNTSNERRALCEGLADDYLDACLFGAGVIDTAPMTLARLNESMAR
jgi:hypothetical protein